MDSKDLFGVINEILSEVGKLRRYDLTSDLDANLQDIKREVVGRRIRELEGKYKVRLTGTPEGEYLQALVEYYRLGEQVKPIKIDKSDLIVRAINYLNMQIHDLDLSVRATTCLKSGKINYVGELVQTTEADLLKLSLFGKTSLREVKRKLADMGLCLGMRLENYVPPQVQQLSENYPTPTQEQ
ncbi:hypothetical protein HYV88_05100 [Candidatus Woesearchaeota archaeon]|nr:hypothetical protein [Candidatus Woesearchaeota archaeon]